MVLEKSLRHEKEQLANRVTKKRVSLFKIIVMPNLKGLKYGQQKPIN